MARRNTHLSSTLISIESPAAYSSLEEQRISLPGPATVASYGLSDICQRPQSLAEGYRPAREQGGQGAADQEYCQGLAEGYGFEHRHDGPDDHEHDAHDPDPDQDRRPEPQGSVVSSHVILSFFFSLGDWRRPREHRNNLGHPATSACSPASHAEGQPDKRYARAECEDADQPRERQQPNSGQGAEDHPEQHQ